LKKKNFIITTEGFEDILREIKEEMSKVLKSTENSATKDEYDDLKKKLKELETKMSDEQKGKLENEKEVAELKKTITDLKKKLLELETKMSKVNEENLENAELKKKLGVLETLVSEQKEVKQISLCL
jgi:chromosome segregation ATPase